MSDITFYGHIFKAKLLNSQRYHPLQMYASLCEPNKMRAIIRVWDSYGR